MKKIYALPLALVISAASAHADFTPGTGDEISVSCSNNSGKAGLVAGLKGYVLLGDRPEIEGLPAEALAFKAALVTSDVIVGEAKQNGSELKVKEKKDEGDTLYVGGVIRFDVQDAEGKTVSIRSLFENAGTSDNKPTPFSAFTLDNQAEGNTSTVRYKDVTYATTCQWTPLCRDRTHGSEFGLGVRAGDHMIYTGTGYHFVDGCEAFGKPRFRALEIKTQIGITDTWFSLTISSLTDASSPEERAAMEIAINKFKSAAPGEATYGYFNRAIVPLLKQANATEDAQAKADLVAKAKSKLKAYLLN